MQDIWSCVQTQKVQIRLWCSNCNTVHKWEIRCPPPPFTMCSECTRFQKALFYTLLKKIFRALPATTPHDINTFWKHGYTTADSDHKMLTKVFIVSIKNLNRCCSWCTVYLMYGSFYILYHQLIVYIEKNLRFVSCKWSVTLINEDFIHACIMYNTTFLVWWTFSTYKYRVVV